jgi:hypothetical protein
MGSHIGWFFSFANVLAAELFVTIVVMPKAAQQPRLLDTRIQMEIAPLLLFILVGKSIGI